MPKIDTNINAAHRLLNQSKLHYQGKVIGTIAAVDPDIIAPNYQECFVRDFVPSALVFLLDGQTDIIKNFLETVLSLKDQQPVMAGHQRSLGLLPASFKVLRDPQGNETIQGDFGDRAIGRVAPVDSALWWMILLRAYCHTMDDSSLAEQDDFQEGMRLILELYLKESFETSPAMLVPDGSFMIDRRMGVYGHPLEIQALFYGMLLTAHELLLDTPENKNIREMVHTRMQTLRSYVRIYYWLDIERLNEIHRLKTEEFGHEAVNVLNIYPEIIPDWIDGWLSPNSGYLVGNLGAGRMDFRVFTFGNLLSILFGLATDQEAQKIMMMFDEHWDELIGEMPLKILYPAATGARWAWVTGNDPKNSPWSYHNGGSWPCLLWSFTSAAITTGREDLAQRAMDLCAKRLKKDNWPEYYDGKKGTLIGRRANYNQTWTAASFIISHELLQNPEGLKRFRSLMFNGS